MIDENLQVAATISPDLTNKVLVLSMGEVGKYGQSYRRAIIDYKNMYFKNRTAVSSMRYVGGFFSCKGPSSPRFSSTATLVI